MSKCRVSETTHVLIVGYGAVGQSLTPLLLRHFELQPGQVHVIASDDAGLPVAQSYGLSFLKVSINPGNLEQVLAARLGRDDWLINVSVDVSSVALIDWCQEMNVLYFDACVEPWAGGYSRFDREEATNAYLRDLVLQRKDGNKCTAIVAHGANPGLISHLVKEGLLRMASEKQVHSWSSWAELAQRLGIKAIQIAERDTQAVLDQSLIEDEFTNTWSVKGLLSEAWQCVELGWGTHEGDLPSDGFRLKSFETGSIGIKRHGGSIRVRSWVPSVGEQDGFLLTHHESISIASLLTLRDEQGGVNYRPTVYYAYHPAPATCSAMADVDWDGIGQKALSLMGNGRVLREELDSGFDQLGALFVFDGGAYWYGSTLSLNSARLLAPHNSATTLQTSAGIIGAIQWALENPRAGVVEAEDLDHQLVMHVARPYLGEVRGYWTSWQPEERGKLMFQNFVIGCEEFA